MAELTCKSCWHQEGGRCYFGAEFGKPDAIPRDERGRSLKLADKVCEHHTGKRAVLEQFIPGDRLVIMSEHGGDK